MKNKELRTYNIVKAKNLDLYLYLKTSFDFDKTYEEIRQDYKVSLQNITKDEKIIKDKMTRLYHTYYSHFRNREIEKKGINDITTNENQNCKFKF